MSHCILKYLYMICPPSLSFLKMRIPRHMLLPAKKCVVKFKWSNTEVVLKKVIGIVYVNNTHIFT